ncbi:transcriptional regulator, TetR family [Methylocella silvestris BL2]|uniref:Transcriptional regulator, TetR family n=1 Tax=Methylocella silvestris (strain DSM 15510 / CIP 108128 / LMG 27833 / NCIMB 13906 / BL2) TaxID=395965 RepID=B8ETJ3_METSB|nr:TetR/AcrR family transcriptional regulator [Methylocella silvestris]ACK52345.1 transcriptional regulator, TetR family [Methylocella silvestris BL2]
MNEALDASPVERPKPRGGRPTRAAAILRDERLLEIATDMFLQSGFDGTSMDRLAETAMIGKATLYARYADKAALFADVLRRRVMSTYGQLENELQTELDGTSLEEALLILARRFLQKAAAPDSAALIRIIAAQAERFPELAKLAMQEGAERQIKLVEAVFLRFAASHHYALSDLTLAADLFLKHRARPHFPGRHARRPDRVRNARMSRRRGGATVRERHADRPARWLTGAPRNILVGDGDHLKII